MEIGKSKLLCTIAPARLKAFVRLLKMIVKIHGPQPLHFQDGCLTQTIGGNNFVVELDAKNFFSNPKGFTVSIIATNHHLQQLSFITSSDAKIYDREDELFFCGSHTAGTLLKSSHAAPLVETPFLQGAQKLGEDVRVEDPSGLLKFVGKAQLVNLLCFRGQLERIVPRGKQAYTLCAASLETLSGQQSDAVFVSSHFLSLAGKLEMTLSLWRNEEGVWLKTSSRSNMVNALTTYELLHEGTIN